MTTTVTKLQLGAAAFAMAGAAAIVPVVAQADIAAPLAPSLTSFSQSLGSAAGQSVCDGTAGGNCYQAVSAKSIIPGNNAKDVGTGPFQNNAIWIGKQNASFWNSPNTVNVWTFTPLNTILWAKPFIPGLWGWFESQSQQSCFIGITTALGAPYSGPGQYTHSYNHKGCNPS